MATQSADQTLTCEKSDKNAEKHVKPKKHGSAQVKPGSAQGTAGSASMDVVYGFEDPERNLLKNWSFERPISDDDWKVNNAEATRVKDSHSGEWSLHIHTRRHKHGHAYQRVSGLKPSSSYYYSCFLKFLTHPEERNYFKTRMFVSFKLENQAKTERKYIGRLSFQRGPTPWHQLGGDFITPDQPFKWAEVCLEIEDHCVDYLMDTASLIELPADPDWKRTLDEQIQKHRTSTVNLNVRFPRDVNPRQFLLKVRQKKLEFGFGGGIAADKFNEDSEVGKNYRECFFKHFEWAVFINDTKWKQMERRKGQIKVARVDKALETLHSKGITVRGHAIHWNRMESCPDWVHSLQGAELQEVIDSRVQHVVNHFKGRLVQWDACNEQLHNHFFEQRTSDHNHLSRIFRMAHDIDPDCHLYLNDYQLVRTGELTSAQANLARDLLAENVPVHGIGVQSHLRDVPIPVEILQKRVEILCAVGLPLMMTEFSVHTNDVRERARCLEEALYVYFSNPGVDGVTFWNFSDQKGVTMGDDMPLFEGQDFKPNEAGRTFRSLLKKWRTKMDIRPSSHHSARTFSAFHGQYELEVIHKGQIVWSRSFKVVKNKSLDLDVEIDLTDPEYCSGYLDQGRLDAHRRVSDDSSSDESGEGTSCHRGRIEQTAN